VTQCEAVEVQRILRRFQRPKAIRVQRLVRRRVRPDLIDPGTGEILREAKYRMRRSGVRMGGGRHLGAPGGGYMVVNDGPAMAVQIGRYLAFLRGSPC